MLKVDLRPAHMTLGTRRIHYGWIIVVLAGLMWMTSGSIRFSASVLVPHLHDPDGMGWSYAAVGFAFSLQWFLSGFAGPAVGWACDRYGVRRTMFRRSGALHRRHDAYRHHDPTLAVLPLLWHHPGNRDVHLPSAARIRDERVVQDPLRSWRWAAFSSSRALASSCSFR